MNVTKETHAALKLAYTKAVEEKVESFMFQGAEILVSYAKYLLEYLDFPENLRKIK